MVLMHTCAMCLILTVNWDLNSLIPLTSIYLPLHIIDFKLDSTAEL